MEGELYGNRQRIVGSLLSTASIFFALFLTTPNTQAQSLSLKGQWTSPVNDAAEFVNVKGNFAYVFTLSGALTAVDVSNPAHPGQTAQIQLTTGLNTSIPCGMTVSGNYLYALGKHQQFDNRLYIVDISNPSEPSLVSSFNLANVDWSLANRFGVAVDGGNAYVSGGKSGSVTIVDVSNPAAPTQKGIASAGLSGKNVWDVEIANGLAYLGTSAGLDILDITDPLNAWHVGGLTGFDARYLTLRGNYAYVTGEHFGNWVYKIDISNPAAPTESAALLNPATGGGQYLYGVATSPSAAFVSGDAAGVGVIDITSATTLNRIAALATPVAVSDVAISGSTAYLANLDGGLAIYDIQAPSAPVRLGALEMNFVSANPKAITLSGNLAFVRNPSNGILIFDVSNLAQPALLSTYLPDGGVGTTAAAGNLLYVTTAAGFDIVSVATPAAPSRLGSYRSSGGIPDIALSGNYVFTTSGEVVNVANPASPQKVNTLPDQFMTFGAANLVKIYGNLLALLKNGSQNGLPTHLFLIDIADPTAPKYLGDLSINSAAYFDFAIAGGYLYLADAATLAMYNISVPANITGVGNRSYGSISLGGIEVVGNTLYQSRAFLGNPAQLALDDITDPINPVRAAALPLAYAGPTSLAVSGENVLTLSQQSTRGQLVIYQGTLGNLPERPTLSTLLQPGKIIVRWPSSFTGMKLYSTSTLGEPWALVTSSPYLDGSSFTFTNTHATAATLFYKLSSN